MPYPNSGGIAAPYNGCFSPLAGCSQGVCFENGELLIAAVLFLIFILGRDKFPPGPPPWESCCKN